MNHEKNISAKQIKTRPKARFSEADVHKSGAADHQPAQSKRTEKAFGLMDGKPASNEITERQNKEGRNAETSKKKQACDWGLQAVGKNLFSESRQNSSPCRFCPTGQVRKKSRGSLLHFHLFARSNRTLADRNNRQQKSRQGIPSQSHQTAGPGVFSTQPAPLETGTGYQCDRQNRSGRTYNRPGVFVI